MPPTPEIEERNTRPVKTSRLLAISALLTLYCAFGAASEDAGPSPEADSPAKTAAVVPRFVENQHYKRLPIAVETRDPTKIEVVEVFSYLCPHCYSLEAPLAAWLASQPEDVDFYRLPMATMNLQTLAQAYYTAESMGILARVHLPIFESIHLYEIDMRRPQYMRRLFVREADVDEEEFMRTFESFGVMTRVRQADARTRMYRILGTPSMIVNGRYLAETTTVGSIEGMLRVVNQLVAMEREAAGQAAAQQARATSLVGDP